MDTDSIINSCVVVINVFAGRDTFREFELLVYEQACRTLENAFREFREWETPDELGSCT